MTAVVLQANGGPATEQWRQPMMSSTHRTWLKRLLLLAAHHSPMTLRALTALRLIDRTEFKNSGRWEKEYRVGGWDWLWESRDAIHHQVMPGVTTR